MPVLIVIGVVSFLVVCLCILSCVADEHKREVDDYSYAALVKKENLMRRREECN